MKMIIFFVAALSLFACNNNSPSKANKKSVDEYNDRHTETREAESDADFLVKVADANMLEIEMGMLAQASATSPHVKAYGEMLVTHHSKMLNELKSLAESKGIALPALLSDKGKEKVKSFADEHAKDFDEEFMEEMVEDHKKDIREFEKKITDDKTDRDIKNWLTGGLPVLRDHLQKAEELHKRVDD